MTVRITDTTLRDAHQSLLATRMRTEDMLPIAPVILSGKSFERRTIAKNLDVTSTGLPSPDPFALHHPPSTPRSAQDDRRVSES